MSKKLTQLIHEGRGEKRAVGPVNPPVMRASTIVYDSVKSWRETRTLRETKRVLSYGARGTETAFALEELVCKLEGGYRAQLYPTGLAALATVILKYARPGKHILFADPVYGPIRTICKNHLEPNGVEFSFFKGDGSDFEEKLQDNTVLVFCETPGSLIYEMQDLRKICEIAHARGIPVGTDNTWGSAWYYNPMNLGVDISVIAATKYLCGHSDVTMGISVVNEKEWPNFANYPEELGQISPADDAYLVLRGMRTMGIRMEAHQKSATMIAKWLQTRPEIEKVYYPALEDHPGHEIWKRDCTGANGLLTVEFKRDITPGQTDTFIDALQYFSIGASWGGYESLVLPANVQGMRTATDWSGHGIFIRMHIGLEDAQDLQADLDNALNAMKA